MRLLTSISAGMLLAATPGQAQDKPDFNVGGQKWRCEHDCNKIMQSGFQKVEQAGAVVTFTDAKGNAVTGTAKTAVTKQSGPSLKCQMNPSFCGPADKRVRTSYYRTIEIPQWDCVVSVQEKDGEPNTPPPFKAKWLRFLSQKCAMGNSIWTTLSVKQVKALRRRCGEWDVNC